MAKNASKEAPVHIPDFVDVDADAVTAAVGSLRGASGWSIPDNAKRGPDDKKGGKHYRWTEAVTVESAYRSVAKSGLMDVVVVVKSRPGQPNEGKKEFLHFYINTKVMSKTASKEEMGKHENMTNQSLGAMTTLIQAAGKMPKSGGFKASLLNLMFPQKNQPGAKSPLDGVSVTVNAHGQVQKKTNTTTNAITGENSTEEVEDTRITGDSFTPDEVEEADED